MFLTWVASGKRHCDLASFHEGGRFTASPHKQRSHVRALSVKAKEKVVDLELPRLLFSFFSTLAAPNELFFKSCLEKLLPRRGVVGFCIAVNGVRMTRNFLIRTFELHSRLSLAHFLRVLYLLFCFRLVFSCSLRDSVQVLLKLTQTLENFSHLVLLERCGAFLEQLLKLM